MIRFIKNYIRSNREIKLKMLQEEEKFLEDLFVRAESINGFYIDKLIDTKKQIVYLQEKLK